MKFVLLLLKGIVFDVHANLKVHGSGYGYYVIKPTTKYHRKYINNCDTYDSLERWLQITMYILYIYKQSYLLHPSHVAMLSSDK